MWEQLLNQQNYIKTSIESINVNIIVRIPAPLYVGYVDVDGVELVVFVLFVPFVLLVLLVPVLLPEFAVAEVGTTTYSAITPNILKWRVLMVTVPAFRSAWQSFWGTYVPVSSSKYWIQASNSSSPSVEDSSSDYKNLFLLLLKLSRDVLWAVN